MQKKTVSTINELQILAPAGLAIIIELQIKLKKRLFPANKKISIKISTHYAMSSRCKCFQTKIKRTK